MEFVNRYVFTTSAKELYDTEEKCAVCTYDELIRATMKKINMKLCNCRIVGIQEIQSTDQAARGAIPDIKWHETKVYTAIVFAVTKLPQDIRSSDLPTVLASIFDQ